MVNLVYFGQFSSTAVQFGQILIDKMFDPGTSCKTWIELPQMRDMTDLIGFTKYVSKRCFDKILIYIDVDVFQMSFDEVFDLMLHQIDFLGHVFGKNIKDNVGVYFQNSTKPSSPEMISALKNVLHDNVPVSQLN